MMSLPVSALYAALLAFILIGLTVNTIRHRRRLGIVLGDQGEPVLKRAVRAHANFCEHVPMALLLFVLLELTGHSTMLLHALGLSLVIGRLVHAFGISQVKENFRWRIVGMTISFAFLGISASMLFVHALTVMLA